jgi:hypothetical protein
VTDADAPDSSAPEWARLVHREVAHFGFSGKQISERSHRTAGTFFRIDPDLKGNGFSSSTLSRMKTGKNLAKPSRAKIVVLHLSLQCLKISAQMTSESECEKMMAAAVQFSEEVMAAVAQGLEPAMSNGFQYDQLDPRQSRTADLFGSYGLTLLEQASNDESVDSLVKLALLHWLEGNVDDARHWRAQVSMSPADGASAVIDVEIDEASAAQLAYRYGRHYSLEGERKIASIYLELAAGRGHMDAAYLLGDICEARDDHRQARRWFLRAEELGHSVASRRARLLETME